MKNSKWFCKLDFEAKHFWKWLNFHILNLLSGDFKVFVRKSDFFHSMKSTKVDQVYLMNAVVVCLFWVLFWYSFLFLISQMLLSKWSADHLRFYLYLAKRRREEYNMTTTNALLSSQSSNYQRSFILGNTNKNIISLRIHACNPILYPGIHLCIYKK